MLNKSIIYLLLISAICSAEEPGRAALRNYCESNLTFSEKLMDDISLDGPKSNKNVAFSGFSITLSNTVSRGGFPVILGKNLVNKLEDPAYLSFEENDKGYAFKISAVDDHEFGDKFFSMLRFLVIIRFLGEDIKSGKISKKIDIIEFEKIYNDIHFKSSKIVKDGIDKFYSEWIIAEKVKYNVDKWQKETEDIKMVIEANKSNQRSTMIRELHESIKKLPEE